MPSAPPGGIGNWDSTYLTKFLNDWLRRNPLPAQDQLTIKKVTISDSATAPTPNPGDSSTNIATSAFVTLAVSQAVARTPKITTSAISGGPPASPSDGDIWIATGVDANGTRWSFQYNAGSSSQFKWEFIGGSALRAEVDTAESGVGPNGFDLATVGPLIHVPRAGDYIFNYGVRMQVSTAGTGAIAELASDANGIPNIQLWQEYFPAAFEWLTVNATGVAFSALPANDRVRIFYNAWGGAVTATFSNRHLECYPIRIS